MSTRTVGTRVKRNEDGRLIRGQGRYVDDVPLENTLHGAFLRSNVARARISNLDVSRAAALPGVHKVYTFADLGDLGVPMPLLIPHPCITHGRTQYALAKEDVYHVGQAIAFVVADDRYIAEDAVALIDVDYERLPVEMDLQKAMEPGAPLVHDDVPNNLAAHLVQNSGDIDDAFARAEHVSTTTITMVRGTAAPMECLAIAARWDKVSNELTVWDGTQAPIGLRGALASLFALDEHSVRVIAPDVGGGFGPKVLFPYSHEILVPLATMELGRPVKYIEDRAENFVHMTHERTQIHTLELAATNDGVVLGVRDKFIHDTGAFIPYGIAVAQVASCQIAGPYRIPAIEVEFSCVYTPTVCVTPYRGAGRPHANFAIERAMDQLADELGLDRWEIRRRNLVRGDEFPYRRPGLIFADGLPVELDSGDYHRALETLHDALDLDALEKDRHSAHKEGRYLGLGLAFYVEGTGLGPYEGGHVRVHPITGKIFVNTGLTTQGQGHATVFAQIVADQLGTSPEDVIVIEGDTGIYDWGVATFASRAAVVSGSAIHKSAVAARKQVLEAASNMLEVDPADLDLGDGKAFVKGAPENSVTLAEVATASNPLRYAFNKAAESATQFAPAAKSDGPPLEAGKHPGIEATEYYSPPAATWAYGMHAAVVEVDMETFDLDIKRYVCVHDCGTMLNPMIVEGQISGGVAQGIGGAFYEKLEYDEDGTLRNASFMDFLIPYATEIPHVEMIHQEVPTPLNELGMKGVGEAGTIPVPTVIASAVEDALKPLKVGRFHEVPLNPSMIFDRLAAARQ